MASIDSNVGGLLATAIAARIIERLHSKGLLTLEEAEGIYTGALNTFERSTEQAEAADILRAIMPGANITL